MLILKMQRIITKQYYFTLLFLSITLITNINLISIYSEKNPTNFLFPSSGKAIDKENFINGSSGNDIIKRLFDIDTLYGHTGNDTLQAGALADKLFGGDDNDTLQGGDDNDTLQAGALADKLFGGDDNDTLAGQSDDVPKEVSPEIELSSQIYDPREIIPIGVDIPTGNATGTVWDDIIIGDDKQNFINGSSGNDIIKGLFDIDTLYGHTGNDILQAGALADKLFGGDDDDTLAGQSDDDYLTGGNGNDKLFGDSGDDTLQGGFGSDYFNCGDGIDNIIDYSEREADIQDVSCEIVDREN